MRQEKLWNKFENHLLNESLTKQRIKKLKAMFNIVERGLKADFEAATREDIERFVTALHRDTFRKLDGKNFTGSTKSDLKKFLRQFYKWLKGDNEFCPKEVSWIKARISKDEMPKEKPVLDMNKVMALANSFNKIEFRMLVLLLFDSGFRIREILSVKKQDISWEEYDETQKCFWLQCNQSKTEKRNIPVPLFTEDLKGFVNSSYYQNLKDDELVFQISYPYFLRKISENSLSSFKIKITPHSLRHSSATYYAREFDGNMNMLAERYGWTYSSRELRTYIRRSGAYQKAGAKKVFTNEVMRIKEENQSLREEMESQMRALQQRMKELEAENQEYEQINRINLAINAENQGFHSLAQMVRQGKGGDEIAAHIQELQEQQRKDGENVMLKNLEAWKGVKGKEAKKAIGMIKDKLERMRT